MKEFFSDSFSKKIKLETRKILIEHILDTEKNVREALETVSESILEELYRLEREGKWWQVRELIDAVIQQVTDETESIFELLLEQTIEVAVEAGTKLSKDITFDLLRRGGMDSEPIKKTYYRIHREAVDHMQKRTIKGLNLSDRIWSNSKRVNQTLGMIVKDGIFQGEHPVEIAKKLETYVQNGARTLVTQYPNMMDRIGDMLPNDLSYEALRLARTEMMAAYGEATKQSLDVIPSMSAVKWSLSNAGVACHVCVENSKKDVGHGPGVYEKHQLPEYPAHPNCMCQLTPYMEDRDDFVDRLIEWKNNPSAHPDIEEWYKRNYMTEF